MGFVEYAAEMQTRLEIAASLVMRLGVIAFIQGPDRTRRVMPEQQP